MSDPVPLSHVQLETDIPVEQLAREHADFVVEDFLGRLCLPRQIAREVIVGHRERLRVHAVERQEYRQRSSAIAQREREGMRERLAARGRRDAAVLAGDGSLSALQLMMSSDVERRLDARGQREARLARSESFGASYGKRGR